MEDTNTARGDVAIYQLISGFQKSAILFTACELGIFDVLEDGRQQDKMSKTAEEVATELSTHVEATERLLDACASMQLLRKSWERDSKALYSNTDEASKYLTKESKTSLWGYAIFAKRNNYPMMGNLDHAVREGQDQHLRTFGLTRGGVYEKCYSDEDRTRTFIGAMNALSAMTAESIGQAFDLSVFRSVCDFGGGSGVLAYEMSRMYPEMSIKVLELPPVVKLSKHFEPNDGVKRNVQFVAGDFFVDELPEAELYIFSMIFHNWSEDRINQILRRAHKALIPGGAILIAERLYNDTKTGPVDTAARCMQMLVLNEGKERPAKEYKDLLEKNGFSDVRVKRTRTLQDAVFARRY